MACIRWDLDLRSSWLKGNMEHPLRKGDFTSTILAKTGSIKAFSGEFCSSLVHSAQRSKGHFPHHPRRFLRPIPKFYYFQADRFLHISEWKAEQMVHMVSLSRFMMVLDIDYFINMSQLSSCEFRSFDLSYFRYKFQGSIIYAQ